MELRKGKQMGLQRLRRASGLFRHGVGGGTRWTHPTPLCLASPTTHPTQAYPP